MIRPATPADIPRIVELGALFHAMCPEYQHTTYSARKVEALMESVIAGEGVAFVYERAGVIVGGCAGGVAHYWFSDDDVQGFDYSIFVLPDARNGFIAAKLVVALGNWCKARGARILHLGLTTGLDHAGTARLYREYLGMHEVGPMFKMEL